MAAETSNELHNNIYLHEQHSVGWCSDDDSFGLSKLSLAAKSATDYESNPWASKSDLATIKNDESISSLQSHASTSVEYGCISAESDFLPTPPNVSPALTKSLLQQEDSATLNVIQTAKTTSRDTNQEVAEHSSNQQDCQKPSISLSEPLFQHETVNVTTSNTLQNSLASVQVDCATESLDQQQSTINYGYTEDARLAREALLRQALIQQSYLREQLMRVFQAKSDYRQQSAENRLLHQYASNLMATTKRQGFRSG
ncbi:hypothetical protein BATDEDRAFT_27328 [Batrachochytrium dendrobatidis JAM81]|uniref:Uncharacterized protein n=2 Tax=Batrachochytrium dendrobatidis TaxID=109871 RepID=F4PAI4_BATDJ|nr:uncharacterized protein BATDEDRAFT_27328 [Batrachochytrium dendrobatidis JAM81]EGF77691.1 hypothetical protein BATDEDRAFT_27328 [Batrachochytrium dendrobatidis JAM81]OAJ43329.1 hypothetical protein BDEG_26696 [Batrachochytrium dendrobatidis JEL423]|eukprot:XP_006681653.1 hypothetical protein BATDEDRAFT_27328 [Batrachochytrium dendrobatidis JAM81]